MRENIYNCLIIIRDPLFHNTERLDLSKFDIIFMNTFNKE